MEFSVSLQDALFDDKYLYIILISLVLASLICFVTFCTVPIAEVSYGIIRIPSIRKSTISVVPTTRRTQEEIANPAIISEPTLLSRW